MGGAPSSTSVHTSGVFLGNFWPELLNSWPQSSQLCNGTGPCRPIAPAEKCHWALGATITGWSWRPEGYLSPLNCSPWDSSVSEGLRAALQGCFSAKAEGGMAAVSSSPPLKIISAPGNHGKEVLRALVGRLPGVRPPGSALCPTDHLKILLPPLSTV